MIRVSTNRMDLIRESHDSADGGICTNSNLSLKSNHYSVYNNKFVGFIRLHISILFSYFACVFVSMRCVFVSMRCAFVSMRCAFVSKRCVFVSKRCAFVSMRCVFVSKRCAFVSMRCALMSKRCVRIYKQYKQIHFRLMSCLLQLYQNNILIMYCLLYDIKAYLINLRHFTEKLQLNNTNLDNWFDKRRILLSSYETIALIGK